MRKLLIGLVIGASISFVTPLWADIFAPSPICSKPYKPFEFTSEFQVENFYRQVESYKQCISDFVDEQSKAISNHQKAIDDALEEWNSFVRYTLN